MEFQIQPVEAPDHDALLALNTASVPHVNLIGLDELRGLVDMATAAVKVLQDGVLAGCVIALGPGCDYASLNYQWFSTRFDRFLYIDRILVVPAFRRQGGATRLYDYLAETGKQQGLERLCCEVNVRPPNPGSLALHHRIGFIEAGQQETEAGAKAVSLLVKDLAA